MRRSGPGKPAVRRDGGHGVGHWWEEECERKGLSRARIKGRDVTVDGEEGGDVSFYVVTYV